MNSLMKINLIVILFSLFVFLMEWYGERIINFIKNFFLKYNYKKFPPTSFK